MKFIFHYIAIILAMFLASSAWADDDGSKAVVNGPREVIEDTVNKMIGVLKIREDKSTISVKDRDAIRQIVKGRFDYRSMARYCLRKPWNKLDEAERERYTNIFRQFLENSYANRLGEYNGQTVEFFDAKIRKTKHGSLIARVKSNVIDGTKKTSVDYLLHETDTGWQVYEIIIAGSFAMVKTFRNQFKPILKDGGYTALLKSLNEKIAKQLEKDQG